MNIRIAATLIWELVLRIRFSLITMVKDAFLIIFRIHSFIYQDNKAQVSRILCRMIKEVTKVHLAKMIRERLINKSRYFLSLRLLNLVKMGKL